MQSLSNVNAYKPNRRKVRVDTLLALYVPSAHIVTLSQFPLSVNNEIIKFLLFLESRAGRTLTVAGAAALDIHMIRMAFIIGIINALLRFAVDADGFARMDHGAFEGIHALPLLNKAFTAGSVAIAGALSSHHDISLAAQMLFIIGTILHRTF